MQITFNPLDPHERDLASSFIAIVGAGITHPSAVVDLLMPAKPAPVSQVTTIAIADQPDTGAPAESAAPLVPQDPYLDGITNRDAPLPAAADLFPTAHAAAPAGVPQPPSAPVPPAPTAPPPAAVPPAPAPAPNPAAGVELDMHGLPWDSRIHSGGESKKNADGSWRKRRGLNDPALVKRVEDELRALMAIPPGGLPLVPQPPATGVTPTESVTSAPGTANVPPAPPVPGDAPNVPPAPPTSAPATVPTPTPPVPPAPTAAAPTAPATGGNPFSQLMAKIAREVPAGRLTEAQVHEALTAEGVAAIGLLAARHDLATNVSARIDQMLGGVA